MLGYINVKKWPFQFLNGYLKRSGRCIARSVKYNINSLKDPFIAQQFSIMTRNKYQTLQNMQDKVTQQTKVGIAWRRYGQKQARKYLGERNNMAKLGYQKTPSRRSSWKDQRKRTLNGHAQHCKRRGPMPSTLKQTRMLKKVWGRTRGGSLMT